MKLYEKSLYIPDNSPLLGSARALKASLLVQFLALLTSETRMQGIWNKSAMQPLPKHLSKEAVAA